MKNHEAKLVSRKNGESMYAVVPTGMEPTPENTVGLLTKYADTPTEKHPWKAFKGVGESVEFIGAFYPGLPDGGEFGAAAALEAALES